MTALRIIKPHNHRPKNPTPADIGRGWELWLGVYVFLKPIKKERTKNKSPNQGFFSLV
jgi:hypothetical protein